MKSKSNLKYVYFILFIILVLLLINSCLQEHFKIVSVRADYNNNYYNVRNDFENEENAANRLAQIRNNIETLIDYLVKNYGHKRNIKNLKKRFDPDNMVEAKHEANSTSYTINKGEEIHVCLREKDDSKAIHDLNLLMFVVLHEMAHLMSDSIGHNSEFRDNFKFILKEASKINIYKIDDYSQNPMSYCGLRVDSTPLS